jgi:DNA sulfur modification protein DndD
LDRKNQDRIKELNRTIEHETGFLSDINREIGIKENEADNFDKLLKNIEQSQESSKY